MNNQIELQQKFFKILAQRKSHGNNILFEVMEVLKIKKGAAYKRMNGETAMTLEEVLKLADHFNVSLDSIFRSDKYISFLHPFLYGSTGSIDNFFHQFKTFIEPLKENDKSEQKELSYLANELPIFYYFNHTYIFNFLMSVWNHLHWEDVQLKITKQPLYEKQAEDFRVETLNNYYGHKVTEIWNSNMLNNLYQQIIFSITIRAFEDGYYVDRLINDIDHLIAHLREVCLSGVKSIKGARVEGSELKIYLNDFGNYLNIVQYESVYIKSTFIGYDYPQFMLSHNRMFYEFSQDWINKIKKRSVLISSEGYQYRELFFIKIENDFKYFKDRVEKLMGIYY
jgi:hypothetical protein